MGVIFVYTIRGIIMNKYINKTYNTKYYGKVTVLEYLSYKKVLLLFNNTGHKGHYRMDKVLEGNIKDPLHKSVAGVGFFGVGKCKSTDKAYSVWSSMLERCYSSTGHLSNKNDSYFTKVSVCSEWHDYQNFAEWFNLNYEKGYQLDKDLLYKDNNQYCPDKCCMLPAELNAVLINNKGYTNDLPVGVTYHKRDKVYVAQCSNGDFVQHIGNYQDLDIAKKAYREFKKERIISLLTKHPSLCDSIQIALLNYEPY